MIPDITSHKQAAHQVPLDWVGMKNVQLPIQINRNFIPAKNDILVNLKDHKAKGIHMSRLYLEAEKTFTKNEFSFEGLKKLAQECIESQKSISDEALISTSFELPQKTKSLISNNSGWRHYPITITCYANKKEAIIQVDFELMYSSTCPCSAALSRQSLQTKFKEAFPKENISQKEALEWIMDEKNQTASPHSQRSVALVQLQLENPKDINDIITFIQIGEEALQTVVQGAVKRIDEQRFAELNAQNLMFSEDAARRLQYVYNSMQTVSDYHIEIQHFESLHPHDAVAIVSKG